MSLFCGVLFILGLLFILFFGMFFNLIFKLLFNGCDLLIYGIVLGFIIMFLGV